MRKKKLLGISLGIITIIIVISLGFVGNYFYNLALNPDTPKDIVFGTKKYIINSKGDFEEDENGESGIKFLKDNFSKIKIKSTESSKRDNKIKFLKNNEKNIFIKKYIVIPPYYRDVNSTREGRVGVGELNKYYSSLIIAVRSLKETQE